ncbi:hypothetical protein BJX62DRAFT_241137 [Aspergillus germanicus]
MPDPSLSQGPIGYMLNQTSDARYNMRLLRNISQGFNLHSLSEILGAGSSVGAPNPIQGSTELSRGDRLYLAAVLACSILQLHGSWLKQEWGTKGVLFAADPQHGSTFFDHTYLLWPVMGMNTHDARSMSGSHRIQNEILLPLAVALIELSSG